MLEGDRLPPCLPACLPAFEGLVLSPLPQVRPESGQEKLGITFPSGDREECRLPRRGCSGHGWDSPLAAAPSSDTPGCRLGPGALARPRAAGWHQAALLLNGPRSLDVSGWLSICYSGFLQKWHLAFPHCPFGCAEEPVAVLRCRLVLACGRLGCCCPANCRLYFNEWPLCC